jgi:tetratricopeptide (TPR) repeat protein
MLAMIAQRTSQSAAVDVVNKMFQPVEIDDLLKQAGEMKDPVQRDLLYFRVVMTLAGKSDFDQALSAIQNINDISFRNGLDSLVRFKAASSLLNKGDLDPAIKYAKSIQDIRSRASLLAKVARILFDKKEPVRASEILADAEQIIRNADEGAQKAQALLVFTEIEARIDPRRGFEVMESTIKAYNEADFKAEDKTRASTSAGFRLSSMLTKILNLETHDLSLSFSLLARADFNRALLLSQTLKKKDRAVLAQLAIFRSILAQKHEKKM